MGAVDINHRWCKGCGVCVAVCPKQALRLEHEKSVCDPEKCVACGMCELYCPDLAILVDKTEKPEKRGEAA